MANALGWLFANEYPEFKQILQNDTDKRSVFDQFDNHCLADGVINYIGKALFIWHQQNLQIRLEYLKNPTIFKIVEDNGLVYQKQLVQNPHLDLSWCY